MAQPSFVAFVATSLLYGSKVTTYYLLCSLCGLILLSSLCLLLSKYEKLTLSVRVKFDEV